MINVTLSHFLLSVSAALLVELRLKSLDLLSASDNVKKKGKVYIYEVVGQWKDKQNAPLTLVRVKSPDFRLKCVIQFTP